LAYYLIYDI